MSGSVPRVGSLSGQRTALTLDNKIVSLYVVIADNNEPAPLLYHAY